MTKSVKAIIIAVTAVVVAAAITIGVLVGTGTIGGKKDSDKNGDVQNSNSTSSLTGNSLKDKIQINHSYIAAGNHHTAAIKNDGTVIASGALDFCDGVNTWKDIISVDVGQEHTVGLKSDGTVIATGTNDHGQCNVSDWTDITCIAAGNYYTLGVRKDGTVLAAGKNDEGQCNVSDWTDIVTVSTSGYHTLGLKCDGSVVATGSNQHNQCEVDKWENIIAVSADSSVSVGLKADGTIVYNISDIFYEPVDPSEWSDIVSVCTSPLRFIGIKADGTLISEGNNVGKEVIESWEDIVFLSSNFYGVIGLKADGTIVASTTFDDFHIYNEEKWFNIRTTPYDGKSFANPDADAAIETTPSLTKQPTVMQNEHPSRPVTPPANNNYATEEQLQQLGKIAFCSSNFDRNDGNHENIAVSIVGTFGSYDLYYSTGVVLYEGSHDPLNLFYNPSSGPFPYYRFDGENVDKLIRNVYGAEPNHNLEVHIDWYNGVDTYAYYHDGYYYVAALATGSSEELGGYDAKANEDGTYTVKYDIVGSEGESLAHLDVEAELIEVEGEKMWTIYKSKKLYNNPAWNQ